MRAILSRTPTFEAWLTRFDAWWAGRSKREQVMLGALAAFLLAVFLIFAVIKPIQAARAQALADIRTAETYNARLRAAGTLASSAPKRSGPPEAMVNASAATAGLVVAVQPVEGGVRATVADASYDSVLNFIADVGATTPLSVRKVSIRKLPAEGHVSAVVELGQMGAGA